jgi:hypothetical protein
VVLPWFGIQHCRNNRMKALKCISVSSSKKI